MKQSIWSNWNFMRFVRLGLGVAIVIQAIIVKDVTLGLLGLLFSIMPIFNIGCCGVGGCVTPVEKNIKPSKEIIYEEVV